MGKIREKTYWIWLTMVPGIGPRRFYRLMDIFDSPENIWQASEKEIINSTDGLGRGIAQKILEHKQERYIEEAALILETPGLRVITLRDYEYPWMLKQIYDPPPLLYYKGKEIDFSQPVISIVGSRRSSVYGRQMAERLAFELASSGVMVVSGLARGIDTMAHLGALKARGLTLGVLGCGIDVVYPPENQRLFNDMEKEGGLLSEYPPGTRPLPGNFPARNRIISGMSHGVLVIEAGNKSGALITVDFALEQGREVYAIPGNINNPQSTGTNGILKQGAKLVTSVEDILDDLKILKGNKGNQATQPLQLDIFETQVYNALEEGERHLEELASVTKMDMARLNAVLTMLEIKGIVKQMPGKIFIRNWDA